MEASGLGGPMLEVVLLPGLLAAGVGTLIFVGLDAWTGLGTFSLAIPGLPHFSRPDAAEFGWAVLIGAAAPFVGWGIRWLARRLHGIAERRPLLVAAAGRPGRRGPGDRLRRGHREGLSQVLFSGQSALGPLSRTAPRTRFGPCWPSSPARLSLTASRWAASAAARSSRRCSSARRAA